MLLEDGYFERRHLRMGTERGVIGRHILQLISLEDGYFERCHLCAVAASGVT